MEKLTLILVLLVVLVLGLLGLTAGQTAVTLHYEQQAQPPSALDAVLASRQTPPIAQSQSDGRWLFAAVPMALILLVGAGIGAMAYGERFMREYRRLRRKPAQPARYVPHASPPDWQSPPAMPTAPNLRQLPPQQESYHDPY